MMSEIEKMNAYTDEFYERAAKTLNEVEGDMVNRKTVAGIIGVQPDQLTNAIWNGTLDIGYGHRADGASKRNTDFVKAKVWRFLTGYIPKCMRQE